ncbi:hypothetical protein BDP27DRAFT_1421018 [Rhodocollybia butyracea]|uniref:DUF6532 domain-containing protein n=1 Tax=Rhodocollybia butyracea TaxID=206335 RepID=A0A9P5PSU3_9AGAR|nr:hypothetical protein BDP27DRAFT_1421018 [Rhodocollybia butyracea]
MSHPNQLDGDSVEGCEASPSLPRPLSVQLYVDTDSKTEAFSLTLQYLLLLSDFTSTRVSTTVRTQLDIVELTLRVGFGPEKIHRVQDLALPPIYTMPLKNAILKAYNGLIGIRYPDVQGGILVMLPNMMTIPPLVLNSDNNPQRVRLRRQLHYGEHNILLNAQPINGTLPHHTLIRFPGAGNSTYIFWTLPQEDDFEAIEGQKLSGAPLGLLSSMLIQQLYTEFMNLFTSSFLPSFANNPEIKLLCPRICHLFSQLSVPSLYEQATMRWHIAQRMILLVEAQIVWLNEVQPTFTEPDAWKVHTLRNVVGTITEDPLEVERLYCAGIPIWYYRSLDLKSTIKVQAWVKEDDIPLRVPYSWIDFEDDSPVGPTVYSRSVEVSRNRYRKMAVECWMIAFPAAIFGADLVHKGVDYTSNPTLSSNRNPGHSNLSHTSTSGPSQLSTSLTRSSSVDSHPCKKQKISRNPPVIKRNKFLEPDSPIMPHAFLRWLKAAETVSHEFKQDELPRRGVNRGYVLPEAAVFANHENEVSQQKYFLTYLKIRRVFIAAIDLLGPIACQRSAKDWRRLVSLELHGSLNSETHESAGKLELCREMNEVAARMGSSFSVDLTNLSQAAAIWRDPPGDFRNFFQTRISPVRSLLVQACPPRQKTGKLEDKYDASTREDRNLIIQDSLFSHGPPAFNHSNPRLRQDTLYALFRIMMGWTRSGRPMHIKTISDGERLGSTHVRGTGELKDTDAHSTFLHLVAYLQPSDTNQCEGRCIKDSKCLLQLLSYKVARKLGLLSLPPNLVQKPGSGGEAAVPKAASKAPPKKVDLKAIAIRQKKDAHKKAQQLKDEDIRKRARDMREARTDEEDDDAAAADSQVLDGPDQTPAPSLDDEDQGARRTKTWMHLLTRTQTPFFLTTDLDVHVYTGSDEEPGHKNDNGESAVGTAQDDVDMDVDSPSNEIQVSPSPPSTPLKKPMERIHDCLHSSTSPPSSRSRSSLSSSLVTPPGRRRGGKITEKHFTLRTCRLAILGKKMNRRATATDQPFPTDKHAYNMDILQDLAHEYKGEGDMLAVFTHVLTSVDTQQELVQFMGYARSGFFTNCMAKARDWVPSCFGIPGKMKSTEVKELVAWLLKDGHYKYGEVDIQNKTL